MSKNLNIWITAFLEKNFEKYFYLPENSRIIMCSKKSCADANEEQKEQVSQTHLNRF